MKIHPIHGIPGAALAMMAAGMALSAPVAAQNAGAAAEVSLVHCSGINQCGGHNDCKTASNACKGQGSCKGQGFLAAPAEACGHIGGSVIDAGVSMQVAASSLVQCYGLNTCKGHNDCRTADNACKGQGSCKGQGFTNLPAATCSNAGGKTSA